MPKFHLISHDLCPYVQRAVIVLTEKQIEHRRSYIDLADKPDWFLNLSPLGRVPVLETEGAVVFESQVIAEYLDEITSGSLHPYDPLEKARHRSWIEFGSETLNAIGALYNAPDADAFEALALGLRGKIARIEQEVVGRYFAGDEFHMIDGVWGTIFRYFDTFDRVLGHQILNGLSGIKEWRTMIMDRPSVQHAAPEGYPARLEVFLRRRSSYISQIIS